MLFGCFWGLRTTLWNVGLFGLVDHSFTYLERQLGKSWEPKEVFCSVQVICGKMKQQNKGSNNLVLSNDCHARQNQEIRGLHPSVRLLALWMICFNSLTPRHGPVLGFINVTVDSTLKRYNFYNIFPVPVNKGLHKNESDDIPLQRSPQTHHV